MLNVSVSCESILHALRCVKSRLLCARHVSNSSILLKNGFINRSFFDSVYFPFFSSIRVLRVIYSTITYASNVPALWARPRPAVLCWFTNQRTNRHNSIRQVSPPVHFFRVLLITNKMGGVGGGGQGVTPLWSMETKSGFRGRDRARHKALEGITDRQTHKHTRSVHYMMIYMSEY